MWQDILLILSFALAALAYFGLTPRRISIYARTTSMEIGKRNVYQKVWLLLEVILSIACVVFIFWCFSRTDWSFTVRLFFALGCVFWVIVCWVTMLEDIWKLSEKGRKITYGIMKYVSVPIFVALWIIQATFDMPWWHKIVYPLIGLGVGYGLGSLSAYLKKKLKRSHPSKR